MEMKRREFFSLVFGVVSWPLVARAQNKSSTIQAANDQLGQVATLEGVVTVTRGNTPPSILHVRDAIYKNDDLQTGANSSLGITFNDATSFSLSPNARIVVNEFVYEQGGKANTAIFNVARGTVGFIASLVAKTGNMTISTPTMNLGIRGTTGVIDVPDNNAAGADEAKIKLYPDTDGHVGRIEVFNQQGGQLGALTRGSSAFAIRPAPGGQFAAVPVQISPQEAAVDRGVVQRLFASHKIGLQAIQRRLLRGPNRQQPGNQQPSNRQPNSSPQPVNPLQQNRSPGLQQKGDSGAPQSGGIQDTLRRFNPFAPRRNDPLPR
jgi:hypothetical protein